MTRCLNIAMVVPPHHTILVDHLCHLFDGPAFNVRIYTTRGFVNDLKREGKHHFRRHTMVTGPAGQPLPRLLMRRRAELDASDLLLVPTLMHHFAFWSRFYTRAPLLLFIHNLKFHLDIDYCPVPRPAALQRLPGWLITEVQRRILARQRRRVLRRAAAVNLHNPRMEAFFRHHWPDPRIVVTTIPFAYATAPLSVPTPDAAIPLRCVVPGEIAYGHKKNFDLLADAFHRLRHRLHRPVELHLLGNAQASAFARLTAARLTGLNAERLSVSTYTSGDRLIPDGRYEKVLSRADLLIAAHRPGSVKHFNGYDEVYGVTTACGIAFEMARFGKPALLPTSYRPLPGQDKAALVFGDADQLADHILRCQDANYLAPVANAAVDFGRRLNRDAILDQFRLAVASLLPH